MDVLKHIRKSIEDEPAVVFARLFGSRADGAARVGSDWDVAVYLDETLDADELFAVRRRLAATLSGPEAAIDLIVLNEAPALLAHRALQGKELLTRDRRAYARFFVRAVGESEDERYFRAVHSRELARRLEDGRFGRP